MVRPSQNDHVLLFVTSVLLMGSPVTDEPYSCSELLVTVWTRQQTSSGLGLSVYSGLFIALHVNNNP